MCLVLVDNFSEQPVEVRVLCYIFICLLYIYVSAAWRTCRWWLWRGQCSGPAWRPATTPARGCRGRAAGVAEVGGLQYSENMYRSLFSSWKIRTLLNALFIPNIPPQVREVEAWWITSPASRPSPSTTRPTRRGAGPPWRATSCRDSRDHRAAVSSLERL